MKKSIILLVALAAMIAGFGVCIEQWTAYVPCMALGVAGLIGCVWAVR